MIEQKIEDAILDKIGKVLEEAGIDSIQLMGQLGAVEGVKGIEQSNADVVIVAKSSPRSYSTPTIPTCQIDVQVTALVRADIDYNGKKYLDINEELMNVFQHW